MDPQEYKIYQTGKAQGKDDAFIKSAIQAYRASSGSAPQAPQAPAEIQQADHGFLGNMAAGVVKPFAREATNLVQAGQLITGNKSTEPFSGPFMGRVKPVGQENGGRLDMANLKDALGTGAEMASNLPMTRGAGLTWDIMKNVATSQARTGAEKYMARQALKDTVLPLIGSGAAAGGMSAGGSSLQRNEDAGQFAVSTGIGATTGAITAPLFGAAGAGTGKILGNMNTGRLFSGEMPTPKPEVQKAFMNKLTQYTRSVLDTQEKAKLKASHAETEYPSIWGKKQNVVAEHDAAVANSVKDLVDPQVSQTNGNIARVKQAVNEFYNNDFVPFLQKHTQAYDPGQLATYMNNKMKPSLMLKPGGENYYAFNQIKNKGMEILARHEPTLLGIQQARSEIDDMITNEFGPAIWEKNPSMMAGVKEGSMKLRNVLNDYTHDSLRVSGNMANFNKVEDFLKVAQQRGMKFNSVEDIRDQLLKHFGSEVLPENELQAILFRNKLKDMNLKLEAVNNMWENSQKEVGKTWIQNVENPYLKAGIGAAGLLGAGYWLGGRRSITDNSN